MDVIRNHNSSISPLAEQLGDQLGLDSLKLSGIVDHLINLSVFSTSSQARSIPVNLSTEELSAFRNGEAIGPDFSNQFLPGKSIVAIADHLSEWSEVRSLAKLFKLESEFLKQLCIVMNKQGKVAVTDLSISDCSIFGISEGELQSIKDGFPVLSSAVVSNRLREDLFILGVPGFDQKAAA